MSVFSTWFQSELDARGWDQRMAAQAIHVRESTIHNWLHQDMTPGVKNIAKIARYMHIPVEVVWEKAGYEKPDGPALRDDVLTQERAQVLASLPQFAEIIDLLASKPPERQAIEIAIIRRLLLDPESNRG